MFFVPILCVHYRTGNALEQITKFLGTLGGVFCVSKVMNKSHLIKALRERVHAALEATLVIYQHQPAALQEEWREAKARLVDLAGSFQEAGDVANVGDHGVAIVRLKLWLLAGLEDASWPNHCQRQHHVSLGGKGLQAFEAGPSETELNETSAKWVSK